MKKGLFVIFLSMTLNMVFAQNNLEITPSYSFFTSGDVKGMGFLINFNHSLGSGLYIGEGFQFHKSLGSEGGYRDRTGIIKLPYNTGITVSDIRNKETIEYLENLGILSFDAATYNYFESALNIHLGYKLEINRSISLFIETAALLGYIEQSYIDAEITGYFESATTSPDSLTYVIQPLFSSFIDLGVSPSIKMNYQISEKIGVGIRFSSVIYFNSNFWNWDTGISTSIKL